MAEPLEGPGLHGDDERWPDGLGEPGEFRTHGACESCGCSGLSSAVRFVPVWDNGSGILTAEEIYECIRKAKAEIILEAEADARKLKPIPRWLPDDVIMHIEGYRDGAYLAIISSEEGSYWQSNARHGTGSRYRGVRGWRHGLALSPGTKEITTDEDREKGQLVYLGSPGALSFSARVTWEPDSEEARQAASAREVAWDRSRPTTSWERHKAALRRQAEREADGD